MPRVRTRSAYLEHQRTFRGDEPNKTFLQEWAEKDADERAAWGESKLRVDHQQAAVTAQEDITEQAGDRVRKLADKLANGTSRKVPKFFQLCDNAIRELRKLKTRWAGLQQAWRALRVVEEMQAGLNGDSIMHAQGKENRARAEVKLLEQRIAQFREDKNHPPVAHDKYGRRRMKAENFETRERSLLNARAPVRGLDADLEAERVGLNDPGGNRWVAQKKFKSNAHSVGWVWLNVDDKDVVQDRVFRKDVFFDEDMWYSPRYFNGDVRDPNSKTPYELACHDALLRVTKRNVVNFREDLHRGLIDHDACTFRLYLEWCQHQDLMDLIGMHAKANDTIAEPFVWYVAEALAECGLVMEHGVASVDELANAGNRERPWGQIVHRDLKPENVFLDDSDPNRYPHYPKPMLGDFGFAMKTFENDPNNPRMYNDSWGTPGLMAPEQMRWINADTWGPIAEWRLGPKTNVFGLGVVLWCLVALRYPDPHWMGDGDDDESFSFPEKAKRYSSQLKSLIAKCVSFKPGDRPSFAEVLDLIKDVTKEQENNSGVAKGMKSGNATPEALGKNAVPFPDDTYRLGFARPRPPN